MEAQNDNVLLGKILDESSYQRDEKHINIDNVINIDFVRENKELHEIKKSKAVEEASIWQVKYYLYYLKQRGVDGLKGKIDYPLLKKTLIVELTDEDIEKLDQVINKIVEIKKQENTPQFLATKLCKNCAYHDLCLI